jgi:hypothetical protein
VTAYTVISDGQPLPSHENWHFLPFWAIEVHLFHIGTNVAKQTDLGDLSLPKIVKELRMSIVSLQAEIRVTGESVVPRQGLVESREGVAPRANRPPRWPQLVFSPALAEYFAERRRLQGNLSHAC